MLKLLALLAVAAAAEQPQPIVFEAEHGIGIRPNLEIIPREGASGGLALGVFEGGGGNHTWLGGPSCSVDIGKADYPFTVERDGTYVVWARAWWLDKCGNSILVSIDGKEQFDSGDRTGEDPVFQTWHWVPSCSFAIDAGPHTLNVMAKEDGIFVDQWMIAPAGVIPSGVGNVNHTPGLEPNPPSAVHMSVYRDSDVIGQDGRLSFVAWIRKCRQGKAAGTLRVVADENPETSCGGELDFEMGPDELLRPVPIVVTYPPASPRSEKRIVFSVACEGITLGRRVIVVTKPFRWRLLGPLPMYMYLERQLGRGAQVDPFAAVTVGTGQARTSLTWREPPPTDVLNRYQTFDFEKLFGQSQGKCVYLHTTVVSPKEQKVLMLVNNDDSAWVWLNGQLVFRDYDEHPAEGYMGREQVQLRKGENSILAKVTQSHNPERTHGLESPNYWLFRLRLRKSSHRPADIWGK